MARILNRSKHALTVAGVTIPAGAGCEVPGWEKVSKSGVIKAWARAGLLVPAAEPPQPTHAEPDPEPAAEPAQAQAEPAEPVATSERGWLSWR